MRYFLHVVIAFTCLFSCQQSFASHLTGGDITYTYLGLKKYEVTVRIYRECSGIPLADPVFKMYDANGPTNTTLSYTRVSIEDITPRCDDSTNRPCKPVNTTTTVEGVELHTFKAIVNFAAPPYKIFVDNNACEIYIDYSLCCRNNTITTITPSDFHIECMMNICNSGFRNSSPQFYNSGHVYITCNQPYVYNLSAFDYKDYDSLKFELIAPKYNHTGNYPYQANHTPQIPMTPWCSSSGVINCTPQPKANPPKGFYFNAVTGDIVFTPTKCDEVGIISVKISEYRKDNNGTWIDLGFVTRDIQMTVKQNSTYPNITPIVKSPDRYTFNARERTCVDIVTFDTVSSNFSSNNRGDVTSIRIVSPPPGSDFYYVDSTAASKTGRFCWDITDSIFTAINSPSRNIPVMYEVKDNFCSYPAMIRKTLLIHVNAPDSSGLVSVNSYKDMNRNGTMQISEGHAAGLRFKYKNSAFYRYPDMNGLWKDSLRKGKYTIGLASHPYILPTGKDTNIFVTIDSSYKVKLGFTRRNGIYGRIYTDKNSNCQYDAGEKVHRGVRVSTDSNTYSGISDNNGVYFIAAPAGTYKVRCLFKPLELMVNCPKSNLITLSINGDSAYDGNDFEISENKDFADLGCWANMGRLTRGVQSTVTFYCKNKGYKTMKNVKMLVPVSPLFDLMQNNMVYAAAGSTAAILIDSIEAGASISRVFRFDVNSSKFKIGDTIRFEVMLDSITAIGDSIKENNYSETWRRVDAPYDPNDKTIEGSAVKTMLDKDISYTIRFQNTGTDTARRVIVTDTIDTRFLDLSTFGLNWSTHPCEALIQGNIIHFIFDDILLPQLAIAGDKSIGSFNFTLGLKSAVDQETSFSNGASIYFDFEKPVITNRAKADIVSPVSITGLKQSAICNNSQTTLYYTSNIVLGYNNQVTLEVSDEKGEFKTPGVFLKTIVSSETRDSIKFKPLPTHGGIYKLRIRTSNPPTSSISSSGIKSYFPLAKPDFQVKSNLNNYSICDRDTLKLEFVETQYDYKVLKNNVELSAYNQVMKYSLQVNKGDVFIVIARDQVNECTDSNDLKVKALDLPDIKASIPNRESRYCEGEQIMLKAAGGQFYNYFMNDSLISNGTQDSSMTIILHDAGTFKVIGNNQDGCYNASDTLFVQVDPLPLKPIITSTGNKLSITHAGLCRWYFNGNLMSQTGNSITQADSGRYRVVAISSYGCENSSDEIFHSKVGLQTEVIHLLKVYPNPASELLSIENPGNSRYEVKLYDLSGKVMLVQAIESENSSIDIRHLSAGIYVLKTTDRNGLLQVVLVSVNR